MLKHNNIWFTINRNIIHDIQRDSLGSVYGHNCCNSIDYSTREGANMIVKYVNAPDAIL